MPRGARRRELRTLLRTDQARQQIEPDDHAVSLSPEPLAVGEVTWLPASAGGRATGPPSGPACGSSAGESVLYQCEGIHIGPTSNGHERPVTSSLAWTHSRDAMREGSR